MTRPIPSVRSALAPLISLLLAGSLSAVESRLSFANGDTLSGTLLQMDHETVTIKSPYFTDDQVSFPTDSIMSLSLLHPQQSSEESNTPRSHVATLALSDRIGSPGQHDQIQGEILDIAENHVEVLTDFAGTLKVDKTLIKSISVAQQTELIYQGPKKEDQWTFHPESRPWKQQPNQLTSPGSYSSNAALDLQLPNKAHIEFSVKSTTYPSFNLYLYSDNHKTARPANYYTMQLQHRDISMSHTAPKRRFSSLRQTLNKRCKLQKTRNTFGIYMDKKKGVFHVFVNGIYTDTYTNDHPENAKLGTSLHLVDTSAQQLEFRNIRLSQWNGTAPLPSDSEQEKHLTGEGETLHLSNGDMLRGILGKIHDGTIEVKTELATFNIPLSGIQVLSKVDQLTNQAKQDLHDVKAYFHNDSWIIIDVDHIDSTHIHGNNEAFGDCKFRLDAFKKIDLQIYNARLNKQRNRVKK